MYNVHLVKLASRLSVATAFILTITKIYGAYITQSLSLLSSLFDSSIDMMASIGNLIAVTLAAKPADNRFRFGYGKLEAISALIQALLIIFSLFYLIVEAVQRFFDPILSMPHPKIGIVIMVISIALTLLLTLFQRYVIKKTNSLAIKADSLHYKTDLAINLVVILALSLSQYYPHIDSISCLFISGFVMWSTRTIMKESLAVLLDKEIDHTEKSNIVNILNNHSKVKGFHNFRTRTSGKKIFIEVHIEMEPTLTLIESHNIAHELKDAVEDLYPESEMIIHQDPIGHDKITEKRF